MRTSRAWLLVACLLGVPWGAAAQEPEKFVETVIRGRLSWGGAPLANAAIRWCHSGYSHSTPSVPCPQWRETHTDAEGRFVIRQQTGVSPEYVAQEAKRHSMAGMVVDYGFAYGLEVEWRGMGANLLHLGMGFGRKGVEVSCDLRALVKKARAERRAVKLDAGNPWALVEECKVQEELLYVTPTR